MTLAGPTDHVHSATVIPLVVLEREQGIGAVGLIVMRCAICGKCENLASTYDGLIPVGDEDFIDSRVAVARSVESEVAGG